jgi:hypothetical protein
MYIYGLQMRGALPKMSFFEKFFEFLTSYAKASDDAFAVCGGLIVS